MANPSYSLPWVGLRAMVQESSVRIERRLSPISVADVVGYPRLVYRGLEAKHAMLAAVLAESVTPRIA
jgi:hypothetical protein